MEIIYACSILFHALLCKASALHNTRHGVLLRTCQKGQSRSCVRVLSNSGVLRFILPIMFAKRLCAGEQRTKPKDCLSKIVIASAEIINNASGSILANAFIAAKLTDSASSPNIGTIYSDDTFFPNLPSAPSASSRTLSFSSCNTWGKGSTGTPFLSRPSALAASLRTCQFSSCNASSRLQPSDWFEGEERQRHSELVGKDPTIVFQVDDCRATFEQFRAQGIEFSMPPTDLNYGIEADGKDLYGNTLVFLQLSPVN
jgi:hypothetical protein